MLLSLHAWLASMASHPGRSTFTRVTLLSRAGQACWRPLASMTPRGRQAKSGDQAGSEASVGVFTTRSLKPVMSIDTSRDE